MADRQVQMPQAPACREGLCQGAAQAQQVQQAQQVPQVAQQLQVPQVQPAPAAPQAPVALQAGNAPEAIQAPQARKDCKMQRVVKTLRWMLDFLFYVRGLPIGLLGPQLSCVSVCFEI